MSFNRTAGKFSVVCISAALCSFPAMAQAPVSSGADANQTSASTQASPADKHFVEKALQGGMAEVKLGQLASEKGSSDDVKQFGQKMVEDHTKLGDQMKQVAQQLGVTPPEGLSPQDRALQARLQALSGDQFDKAYIQAMVKDHKMDLSEFKKEAKMGKSPAVKDAAQQGQEVIAGHLQMIEQIAQKHNITIAQASQ
jgi:putative membrane protein